MTDKTKTFGLLTCNHPETGELITEEFRPIPGYEGKYQVSSFGRVLAMNYKRTGKAGLLRQSKNHGYRHVTLSNGKSRQYRVHGLMGVVFLGHDPANIGFVVNHKNFKRSDNILHNLEVVTKRENSNKKHIRHSSTYTGVHYYKRDNVWTANIWFGRLQYLGRFKDEKSASECYEAALKSINEFGVLPDKKLKKPRKTSPHGEIRL